MPSYTEPTRIGDVLKREFDQLYNRETVTVVSGQNLSVGTVVGKISASGKYTAYDDDAETGEETAAGILLFDCDASGGDARGVILARGPAVVSRDDLAWGTGVTTQGEKDAAYVDLAALGITLREAI